MSSDEKFERILKLWVSLWKLVLDEKRNLEAVCATLQNLVFESEGYPQFKNWEEICKLPDWCQRMALARVDPNSDEGHRFQIAFPECFMWEDEDQGPIPVSILMEYSRKKGTGDGADGAKLLAFSGTLEDFKIPYILVFVDPDEKRREWCDTHVTYDEAIQMGLKEGIDMSFGLVVKFKGQDYFVAEVSGDMEVCLVPVEKLILDT